MPFKAFNKWLFDGNRRTEIDPTLLKYNSPITHTYVISLFQRSGKLNHYLNNSLNNIGLYYLDKEELFRFIKRCVVDFKINRRVITFFPRRTTDDLFDALRGKIAVLKNDDLELLSKIITKSDDRDSILSSLNLDKKATRRKSPATCSLGQKNKISLEELMENFSTIEIGK